MSCEDYAKFNNVSSIGESYLLDQLEENIKGFLDWGLLNIGGFVNVQGSVSGINNNQLSSLKPTTDPSYANGRVWQTMRKDWVWETGVSYNNYSPINISGITINSVNYPVPTGSGSYGYSLNYPLGRVVFNNPITTHNISIEHSYRWCQIYKASASPWWVELQKDLNSSSPQFYQKDKGDFVITANHRVQTPCIIIEPISRSESIPHQLGSTDFRVRQDILLHIFTDRASDKNKLADIIRLQKHKTIWLYDINKVINSGVYGLNYQGSRNSSGKNYNDLVNNTQYRWLKCFFTDIVLMDMETNNNNLFWCTIRLTAEVII
jgi:hypothetical protein